MGKKVVKTVIEEYDGKGNLLKKTIKKETEEDERATEITFPSIPYYYPSWEPTTGNPWWEKITY